MLVHHMLTVKRCTRCPFPLFTKILPRRRKNLYIPCCSFSELLMIFFNLGVCTSKIHINTLKVCACTLKVCACTLEVCARTRKVCACTLEVCARTQKVRACTFMVQAQTFRVLRRTSHVYRGTVSV
jgi:hypothetical protein